jgi:hypothetical protein
VIGNRVDHQEHSKPEPSAGGGRVKHGLDPWRCVIAAAQDAIGPFPLEVAASWCAELDAVQQLVVAVDCTMPPRHGVAPDGALALICLATARIGATWLPATLVDAAAAVELADRAVRHHAGVADRPYAGRAAAGSATVANRQRILDGDTSITRAASLAAGIGPAAYRALVRGYGCVQLAALTEPVEPVEPVAPLMPVTPVTAVEPVASVGLVDRPGLRADASGLAMAAVSLGLIVCGRPAEESTTFGRLLEGRTRRSVDFADASRELGWVAQLVGWVASFGSPSPSRSMQPALAVSGGASAAP